MLDPLSLPRVQAIADLTLRLGQVRRATQHSDGSPESDTTHTVMLALIAADLAWEFDLNKSDVVLFALVHDLVEAYAGDTNTARALTPEERAAKAEREAAALGRLKADLVQSPWIGTLIARYEEQAHPAARFVRYLDKIMVCLTHARNGCRAVKAIDMSYNEMVAVHSWRGGELAAQYPEFPRLAALFDEACAACERVYEVPKPTAPRTCNRHSDCDAADLRVKEKGQRLFADHCNDETCEDCFGA